MSRVGNFRLVNCRELPELRGFSSGNLKKMRIFYEEWQCLSIGSPMANQLQQFENKIEDFVGISFTHHMEILHKTTNLDERIYYIHQVNLHHWNKYVLREYFQMTCITTKAICLTFFR